MSDTLPVQQALLTKAGDSPAASRPANLSAILGRIEEAIERETAAIRADPNFDIKGSNARKSRHLYELNKAARNVKPADISPEQHGQLLRLREKLAANEAALRAHMNAVNEVAALIRTAIQSTEADGTYSALEFGGRRIAS